jgi:hypothetical protein
MSSTGGAENESGPAKWLKKPVVFIAAIVTCVAGAYRIAGVASFLIAKLLLISGVWAIPTIEVWCSKWIKKTGLLYGSIILLTAFVSGVGALFLAQNIANQKIEQAVERSASTTTAPPPPLVVPAPLSPRINQTPSGPTLRVNKYDLVPYKIGEPLKIRMFVANSGTSGITLFGGSHSAVVEKLPSDFVERHELEKQLWATTEKYHVADDRPLNFRLITTFAELMSEEKLTQQRIDQLNAGSVMYLMTILKNKNGKTVIESCIHTDPTGTSVEFCVDHNRP